MQPSVEQCQHFYTIFQTDSLNCNYLSLTTKKSFIVRLIYKERVCKRFTQVFYPRFPDPVTKSQSWGKIVYNNTEQSEIKILAVDDENPFLGKSSRVKYFKILGHTKTLNILAGQSCKSMIKEKILIGLEEMKLLEIWNLAHKKRNVLAELRRTPIPNLERFEHR